MGPVGLPGGERLTAANAAPLLLNEIYVEVLDSDAHDAFFEEASRAVFDALISEGTEVREPQPSCRGRGPAGVGQ